LAATPQRRAGSLDLILPIEQVAEGYKAMDERSAIKTHAVRRWGAAPVT
jgi:hypothetical protein